LPNWWELVVTAFACSKIGAVMNPVMPILRELWGMTEVLSGTLTEPARAADKSAKTDGRSLEGMEIRIVDAEGRAVPTGESGRLLVRGAQMFKGYYKRPELRTFDSEGWFDSGDLAYMDEDGYIRISGRVKDICIDGRMYDMPHLVAARRTLASIGEGNVNG
jgi:long-subunit acyl-CoA synthetase (AMP-forming)